ncbi:MAG: type II secretion system protein [Terracidiphilus sp.]|jgi:type II secretory pathway pseudopilin PulG
MTTTIPTRRRPQPAEEGFMLVAVMFLLFVLVLSMAIAAPIIKKQIQHDQDVETMHRGKQYARGIRMYYKKFGAYPPNMDALVNTNNMRFLRKKYTDPTTGKADWKIIRPGQNKVPTVWGFFGQPLSAAGNQGCGVPGLSAPGSTPGLGSTAISSSGFGSSGSGSSSFGSGGLSGSSTPACPPDTSTDAGSTNGSGSTDTGSTNSSNPNAGNSGSTTTGSNANPSGGAGGTGLTGQTFGGGGIMGVSPNSPKQSILVLHKKNHYNQWEFCYDPLQEQTMMQGGGTGLGGNGAGGPGVGGNGTGGSGIGGTGTGNNGFNGSGSGSSGSTGGTGTGSTPPPTTPQQ